MPGRSARTIVSALNCGGCVGDGDVTAAVGVGSGDRLGIAEVAVVVGPLLEGCEDDAEAQEVSASRTSTVAQRRNMPPH